MEGTLDVAFGGTKEFHSVQAALIAPDVSHQIRYKDGDLVFTYLDPEATDISSLIGGAENAGIILFGASLSRNSAP